ncbi:MAG: hypothetical protein ACREID_05545, partial [Planctomycetota bacterium]
MEDLAKYYEHRVRDAAGAEAIAAEARSLVVAGRIALDAASRARRLRSLDHRLRRLRRKRARGGQS